MVMRGTFGADCGATIPVYATVCYTENDISLSLPSYVKWLFLVFEIHMRLDLPITLLKSFLLFRSVGVTVTIDPFPVV